MSAINYLALKIEKKQQILQTAPLKKKQTKNWKTEKKKKKFKTTKS